MSRGRIPDRLLVDALRSGMINRDFIDDVARHLRARGVLKA
jgi:hypothetical protein